MTMMEEMQHHPGTERSAIVVVERVIQVVRETLFVESGALNLSARLSGSPSIVALMVVQCRVGSK